MNSRTVPHLYNIWQRCLRQLCYLWEPPTAPNLRPQLDSDSPIFSPTAALSPAMLHFHIALTCLLFWRLWRAAAGQSRKRIPAYGVCVLFHCHMLKDTQTDPSLAPSPTIFKSVDSSGGLYISLAWGLPVRQNVRIVVLLLSWLVLIKSFLFWSTFIARPVPLRFAFTSATTLLPFLPRGLVQ